nr:hypothetical protein [uncultured Rhodopila sp.]
MTTAEAIAEAKQSVEKTKQMLRDLGVRFVKKWLPASKRMLIGKIRIVSTEEYGAAKPTMHNVYIDLDHAEWQVRQAVEDGRKSMLMVPLIIEDLPEAKPRKAGAR